MTHWKANYQWIMWKCREDHFYWFKKPILLDQLSISGKTKITSMHGVFQGIEPEKAVAIIAKHLPFKNHSCIQWLENGTFDRNILPKDVRDSLPGKSKRVSKDSSAPPTADSYRYWVEGERSVEPLHARLQAKFVRHLKANSISHKEDLNCIDVVHEREINPTFCEIKPTDRVPTKYAIRIALGQLLEYRFKNNPNASLEIVLGVEPTAIFFRKIAGN